MTNILFDSIASYKHKTTIYSKEEDLFQILTFMLFILLNIVY